MDLSIKIKLKPFLLNPKLDLFHKSHICRNISPSRIWPRFPFPVPFFRQREKTTDNRLFWRRLRDITQLPTMCCESKIEHRYHHCPFYRRLSWFGIETSRIPLSSPIINIASWVWERFIPSHFMTDVTMAIFLYCFMCPRNFLWNFWSFTIFAFYVNGVIFSTCEEKFWKNNLVC